MIGFKNPYYPGILVLPQGGYVTTGTSTGADLCGIEALAKALSDAAADGWTLVRSDPAGNLRSVFDLDEDWSASVRDRENTATQEPTVTAKTTGSATSDAPAKKRTLGEALLGNPLTIQGSEHNDRFLRSKKDRRLNLPPLQPLDPFEVLLARVSQDPGPRDHSVLNSGEPGVNIHTNTPQHDNSSCDLSACDDQHDSGQRESVTPPHASVKALRSVAGLTLDQVCQAANEIHPRLGLTRGGLSAIENGLRGVSKQTLAAIAAAYGLDPSDITTTYDPRHAARTAEEVE